METSVEPTIIDLLQVDLDLAVDGGTLKVGGREIPYTGDGIRIVCPIDGAPTLHVETIALGGRVHGVADVTFEVTFIDSTRDTTWPKSQGPSIPAALRALADQIEAAG